MVLALGGAAAFGVALLVKASNAEHERNGLFGLEVKMAHAAWSEIDRDLEASVNQTELEALAAMVAAFDRASHSGVPVVAVTSTGVVGAWEVSFRDGTTIPVRADDTRSMLRANTMAAHGPLVVSRVHPAGSLALVDLSTPRHPSLRVALRV